MLAMPVEAPGAPAARLGSEFRGLKPLDHDTLIMMRMKVEPMSRLVGTMGLGGQL